jgi:hypothetical protein
VLSGNLSTGAVTGVTLITSVIRGAESVEKAALDHLQKLVEDEVRERFPGGAIERVVLLQYGDDPVVEPGDLAVRVYVAGDGELEERKRLLEDFGRTHRRELEKFREDLSEKLPEATRLEFQVGADKAGPHIMLNRSSRSLEARALAGGDLTPVMARLGPTDLETLDTLITAGIASNRADAVRWALARIRERPAYEQLRSRAREIEELKAQF